LATREGQGDSRTDEQALFSRSGLEKGLQQNITLEGHQPFASLCRVAAGVVSIGQMETFIPKSHRWPSCTVSFALSTGWTVSLQATGTALHKEPVRRRLLTRASPKGGLLLACCRADFDGEVEAELNEDLSIVGTFRSGCLVDKVPCTSCDEERRA